MTAREILKDEVQSLARIFQEFKQGFNFLKKYPKTVSFFGSARLSPYDKNYIRSEELARRVVKELGYAIVTGGGPGIMEAANKGAIEAHGQSIGLTIRLPREQGTNKYVNHELNFSYFFSRKTILTFAAEAYVFFPGGFGTFDELFTVLTLIQTNKIPRVPIILVERSFWTPFIEAIRTQMLIEHKTIGAEDLNLIEILDNDDDIIQKIAEAPISTWWKNIEA